MVTLINPFFGISRDPHWSNVVFLGHFDGTNGSTSIKDNSSSRHAKISSGLAITTSVYKFGSASLQGSGSAGVLLYARHLDWNFGSGQFTIECWARRTTAISGTRTLVAQWPSGTTNRAWKFGFEDTNVGFSYSTGGSDSTFVGGAYSSTLNNFDFFAVDRDGSGVIRVYAGTPSSVSVIGSVTYAGAFNASSTELTILNDGTNLNGFPGQLDELRITKGFARYAGTCRPPIAAFPNT